MVWQEKCNWALLPNVTGHFVFLLGFNQGRSRQYCTKTSGFGLGKVGFLKFIKSSMADINSFSG
jgi:hypothetical protein